MLVKHSMRSPHFKVAFAVSIKLHLLGEFKRLRRIFAETCADENRIPIYRISPAACF